MIKRILYLGYYFKELDKAKFQRFLNHVVETRNISKISLCCDIILGAIKYNISLLEYFNFQFYVLSEREKAEYAGTGYMYEYQLRMNPKHGRAVLADKIKFLDVYRQFVRHSFCTLPQLERDPSKADKILGNESGKVVLKRSDGQCGIGIEVLDAKELSAEKLIDALRSTGNNYVEEFVVQHDELMRLSPSGLNTVRVITQLNKANEVDILGARLRITVNSSVDNLAAGNIAAPIDISTGMVDGPGVYSDITKIDEYTHPVTGTSIVGFKVPFWEDVIEMVTKAALHNTNNRSIGWDVAITNGGPELIEGNHDWCKLLWQLPVKKGLKGMLDNYSE